MLSICSMCVQDGSECTFSPKTEEHSRAILAASTNPDWQQQSSSEQASNDLNTLPLTMAWCLGIVAILDAR